MSSNACPIDGGIGVRYVPELDKFAARFTGPGRALPRKHQLGPPDTQLFASGLATLTSQLPQKSHPTWITMKERLKRVSMEVKLSVDQTKLWFQVHAVSICASPLVAFSFFLNFVQLVR